MINPFTFGNPIRDTNRFIGRESELRQIVNRLRSSAHESTSIVGERRIGKTSLLKHLEDKTVAEQLGLPPDEFCLVYMDLQGLTDITPLRFWKRVLQKIEQSICNPELPQMIKEIRSQSTLDLFDLEDTFTYITDVGLTIVLLLDEFEYVTQNANFGTDFFGALRALAIHHNLPLVTATRRELVDLCHSEELKGSPFFNIFANLVLRPFETETVAELITEYLTDTGVTFSDEETELVLSLGGGYPFFTQMAAHYLFDAKTQGLSGEILHEEVSQLFDNQADAHYQYMWSRASESERITLLAVITLNRHVPSAETAPTLNNLANLHSRAHLDLPELIKRGLLIENMAEETYRLLSPSLERWIMHEILSLPSEEESEAAANEWLTSPGHENLAPVTQLLPKFKKKYWSILAGFPEDISKELVMEEETLHQPEKTDFNDTVFICYSRKDQQFVNQLVADLHEQGVNTWRDVDNIPGQRQSNLLGWRASVEEALNNCAAMLIVLSPGAVESSEVQAEWNHFASRKLPIFPVVTHNCTVPFYLKIYQIWDLSSDYSEQLPQLASALRNSTQTLA